MVSKRDRHIGQVADVREERDGEREREGEKKTERMSERERRRERETGMCGRERGKNTREENTTAIACNRVDREIFITPLLSYAYK